MKLLEVNDIKWYFSLIYNAHFKCFCPGCSKSVTSFCGSTSFLSPYFVQWFYHIYWNIYRFSRIIRGFYWNTKMAHASYFDTKVTELRFKCLQWTIYLYILNNEVDFQIYEDQNNSSIDFEMFGYLLLLPMPSPGQQKPSHCVFLLLPKSPSGPPWNEGHRPRVRHETSVSEVPAQEQHEHSFYSSSTNTFITCSLYTVRRYRTSPGTPDLRARLG